jgi:hypothetical protein
MAAVTGVVGQAYGWQKKQGVNKGPVTIGGKVGTLYGVYVPVTFTGTYASGDDAEFDPTTALESSQNGKTYTVLQASQDAGFGREDGDIVHFAWDGTTITSNLVTGPLLQEDHSTEHAYGLLGEYTDPHSIHLLVHAYPYD